MKSPSKIWFGFLVWSVLEIVSLALWVGGLLMILGGVIPAVFNEGMEVGGRLLTRVFEGYNRIVVGAIVLLVLAASWRIWASTFRQDSLHGSLHGALQEAVQKTVIGVGRTEIVLLTLMISTCCCIVLWLSPASVTLQTQAFAAIGEAEKKEAYEAFFQVHTIVRALYIVNLVMGIGLLVVKIKRWVGPAFHKV